MKLIISLFAVTLLGQIGPGQYPQNAGSGGNCSTLGGVLSGTCTTATFTAPNAANGPVVLDGSGNASFPGNVAVAGSAPGEVDLFDAGGSSFNGLRAPQAFESSFVRVLSSTPPAAGQVPQYTAVGSGATAGAIALSAGGIATIAVSTGGSGYGTTAPLVSINGDGVGALAHANLTAGAVTSITVDATGSGYTTAAADIIPITTESFVNFPASAPAQSPLDATIYPLFGTGDLDDGPGVPLNAGPSLYASTWAFTPPALNIQYLAIYVKTACSASCGYVFAIMSKDLSTTICKTSVETDGTIGIKLLTFASGTAVSGGVCALPNKGLIMLSTSDGDAWISAISYSELQLMMAGAINTTYFAYAAPSATGISGAGSGITIPTDLSSVVWTLNSGRQVPFILGGK
jgi:hypothetical protein